MAKKRTFKLHPIGRIRHTENQAFLEILPEYKSGLFRLEMISHVFVLWWIHRRDTPNARTVLKVIPRVTKQHNDPQEMGVFATRSPNRPNPIGMTLVKILCIEDNLVYIDSIDAYDGTPILDLKPYLPNGDRVEQVALPPWFNHLLLSRVSQKSYEPQSD
ncbi:MAG: tRNA (N6-threonylcarbamoyladenosine(37)-N6)-methyltransferase TrmO [Candidatus Heimdallarchaeota archaeon]